jgi:hypothetical protein
MLSFNNKIGKDRCHSSEMQLFMKFNPLQFTYLPA